MCKYVTRSAAVHHGYAHFDRTLDLLDDRNDAIVVHRIMSMRGCRWTRVTLSTFNP